MSTARHGLSQRLRLLTGAAVSPQNSAEKMAEMKRKYNYARRKIYVLILIRSAARSRHASGARFTKHLKPKIFLSAIQIVWHLRKS